MGLPNINITFKTAAASAIARGARGAVGLILRDSAAAGGYELTDEQQIPAALGAENKQYIRNAFLGYVNRPRKALVYVLEEQAELYDEQGPEALDPALDWFRLHTPDYLAGPPDCTPAEAQAIAAWVKARRAENLTPKAVLPNLPADSEGVINFTAGDIRAGQKIYTAAQYCGRIAGLLAGTPLTISSTYAPLSEVEDIQRLPLEQMDQAVEQGQFLLLHDGKKVKCGRGVNSLVTTTQDKGAAFQKIKIVEAADQIQADLRLAIQDGYIGKYANSYDNKCLLIAAISGYLETLEQEGVLKEGSAVEIDLAKQKNYLKSQGQDVEAMDELAIKKADTGSQVFLKATLRILDAIEDIDLDISM